MKVLFVTLNPVEMNSSAAIRNNAVIHGLIQNGADIEVLTIPPLKRASFFDETIVWPENILINRLEDEVFYTNLVSKNIDKNNRLKKVILRYIKLGFHKFSLFDYTMRIAKRVTLKNVKSDYYDIIISSSDPKSSHYAVKELISKGLKYGKWIQYWGDPFSTDITNKTLLPKGYIRNIEKKILNSADSIIYVSPFTLKEQVKLFPKLKNKMHFYPIPFSERKISKERRTGEKFTLAYLGDYYSNVRNITPLYNAVKKNFDSDVELRIAGNTDMEIEKSENIEILPRITQEEVKKIEEKSDLLVCVLNSRGTQIPGKVYHYAATDKPILVIVDGDKDKIHEICKYIESFNRFIICNNNEVEIRRTIKLIKEKKIPLQTSPPSFLRAKEISKKMITI